MTFKVSSYIKRLTSRFGVFLEEVRDGCLCLESLVIFNKDCEPVAPQRRHISVDGHWVGTYVPSYIEHSECGCLQRCIHTLVFGSTIEGAESDLGRSVGLAVNVNVATCGASLTHQYQRLGWRQQRRREIHTVIQYLNLRAGF